MIVRHLLKRFPVLRSGFLKNNAFFNVQVLRLQAWELGRDIDHIRLSSGFCRSGALRQDESPDLSRCVDRHGQGTREAGRAFSGRRIQAGIVERPEFDVLILHAYFIGNHPANGALVVPAAVCMPCQDPHQGSLPLDIYSHLVCLEVLVGVRRPGYAVYHAHPVQLAVRQHPGSRGMVFLIPAKSLLAGFEHGIERIHHRESLGLFDIFIHPGYGVTAAAVVFQSYNVRVQPGFSGDTEKYIIPEAACSHAMPVIDRCRAIDVWNLSGAEQIRDRCPLPQLAVNFGACPHRPVLHGHDGAVFLKPDLDVVNPVLISARMEIALVI